MRMRVVIEDGLTTGGRPTGIGHYTLGVHSAISRYLSSGADLKSEVEVRLWPHPLMERFPKGYLRRVLYLSWLNSLAEIELWKDGVDVVHYTAHYTSLLKYPHPRRIFTVHDLTAWQFRESLPAHLGPLPRLVVWMAVKNADAIITPTVTVKREVVKQFHVDPDRVFVCCYYARQDQVVLHGDPPSIPGLGRYFLFVGTLEKRKNITTLVKAFGAFQRQSGMKDVQLILVGGRGFGFEDIERTIGEEDLGSRVLLPGYVNNRELGSLYAQAVAFVMPSLYEGFGIPVIEAMAHGAPVIASDIPVLREIAGGAAIFYGQPTDTAALAQALQRIWDDPALCDNLRTQGLVNTKKYTPQRVAEDHLNVYMTTLKALK